MSPPALVRLRLLSRLVALKDFVDDAPTIGKTIQAQIIGIAMAAGLVDIQFDECSVASDVHAAELVVDG